MKFTLGWLKDHLDTDAPLAEIAAKLTAIGLEVEKIDDPGAALKGFIVGHVDEAKQHPNADRLRLCTVSTGSETLQVVCGAPNARAGIKVVLARPGTVIPASGEALKKGAIRGVESQGMMCSARELKLGGRSRRHHRTAGGRGTHRRRCRHGAEVRSGDRDQPDAEPRRCAGRARHRARSGGQRPGKLKPLPIHRLYPERSDASRQA